LLTRPPGLAALGGEQVPIRRDCQVLPQRSVLNSPKIRPIALL
jgi:hypothetical protein